jgi:hypothetical protein
MSDLARANPLLLALLVALGVASGASAGAQSLGEAARQERERRAKIAKPAKVYTEDDLEAKRPSRPAGEAADAPPSETAKASAPPPASGGETGEDEAAQRRRLEADWRGRFAEVRRKIAEAELRCWHSVVRTVFVAGVPVQQWVKEFDESEELRQAKRALVDLEEEFRKTGLPPGWTRE